VYVLHDGSEDAVRGISRLVDHLRCDPQALEIVWLSFISLAGSAKQTVTLTDICSIGDAGVQKPEIGAPDLNGGLSIFFASDAQEKLRKSTANTNGDCRPFLVLFLGTDPGSELNAGLDIIKERRCGRRLAFVGEAVTPLSRSKLTDAGFEMIVVANGMTVPRSDSDSTLSWDEVLSKSISVFPYAFHAAPMVARESHQPPPLFPDIDIKPGAGEVVFSSATTSDEVGVAGPKSIELKPSNLFTADLGNLSTNGRVTRRGLLLYLLLYFGIIVLSVFMGYLSMTLASIVSTVAWGIFVLGLIKRAHDLGLSGWYILIPFFGFWLFFAPGQSGPNKFGPDPRAPDGSAAR
jgi:hypothetical protein